MRLPAADSEPATSSARATEDAPRKGHDHCLAPILEDHLRGNPARGWWRM